MTDINAPSSGWTNVVSGGSSITYNTNIGYGGSVGIGTSAPEYLLTVGASGTDTTSLYVNGPSQFIGIVTTNNTFVSGALTATGAYSLENVSSGVIQASSVGVGTTNPLGSVQVGSAGTQVCVITGIGSVGIGTTKPEASLDVQAHARFKSYSENVGILTIASNVVTVDLSQAQSFICTATDTIDSFTLINIPTESSTFTIRMTQDSTGSRSVGIDTFKDSGGNNIPVYWPSGVVPIVTTTAEKTDIYSFKLFDGTNITSVGMYGIIGGQNFS